MTRPIPDKAEIALEYPNKFYIGTFERTARFDAHLDKAGVSLMLERTGDASEKKAVRMHFHYALFAEILQELAQDRVRHAGARCGPPRGAARRRKGIVRVARERASRVKEAGRRSDDRRRRGSAAAYPGVRPRHAKHPAVKIKIQCL